MGDDREERIRKRAHEIWEKEGRPDGEGHRHWAQAESEVDAEGKKGKKAAPKKAAASKAPVDKKTKEKKPAGKKPKTFSAK